MIINQYIHVFNASSSPTVSLIADGEDQEERIDEFKARIKAKNIEYISLSENVDILADEEGGLNQDNPVFIVELHGIQRTICGSFILGKPTLGENGIVFNSFNTRETMELLNDLRFAYIGKVSEVTVK